jgi:peptidoglycan/xylan/chitin deacetylase (PgdA/CDA1 family)
MEVREEALHESARIGDCTQAVRAWLDCHVKPQLRRWLAHLHDVTPLPELLLALRERWRVPMLTILNYHRVHEHQAVAPFDSGVLDATPEQFERHVATLVRHFNLVGLDDVRNYLAGGRLPPNPAMITFDDGYRDCHAQALPILKRYGARAVFFIATDYVERRRIFWWDRVCWSLKNAQKRVVALESPRPMLLNLGAHGSHRILLEAIKATPGLDLEACLKHLSRQTGTSWNESREREMAGELIMTWDEVRELRRAGMDIGSHTRTHRVLQTLSREHLSDELRGSREDLESALGERVDAVSYPVGTPIAAAPAIRSAIDAAGYEMGFTYNTGVQFVGANLDRLDIRRLSVSPDLNQRAFLMLVALPAAARMLMPK